MFYAKIQDSWENDFRGKSPVDSADTLWVKTSSKSLYLAPFPRKDVFCVLRKKYNGRKKWRENDFWEKSSVDSADTLWVKNFVKITLSRSVSEINPYLRLT